ncbi:hypothetical protein RVBP21_2490 [Pseudomonas phage BRkr]|nr:hypothetical protein RVBP21_2490 [Pseudomonas phage BRkr]
MFESLLSALIKATGNKLPGPSTFEQGDSTLGLYGELTSDKFITYPQLRTLVELDSIGTINTDAGWIKVSRNNVILYYSKTAILHSISPNQLDEAGLIDGSKVIVIDGNMFKVRLMNAGVNPYSDIATQGNEGSELWDIFGNVTTKGSWAKYTDEQLIGAGNGSYNWAANRNTNGNYLQFSPSTTHPQAKNGLYIYDGHPPTEATSYRGWRPVLEYIPPKELKGITSVLSTVNPPPQRGMPVLAYDSDNNDIYMACGYTTGPTTFMSDLHRLDRDTKTWTKLPSTVPFQGETTTTNMVYNNGKLILHGNPLSTGPTIYIYTIATDTWETKKLAAIPGLVDAYYIERTASIVKDDILYIVGGFSGRSDKIHKNIITVNLTTYEIGMIADVLPIELWHHNLGFNDNGELVIVASQGRLTIGGTNISPTDYVKISSDFSTTEVIPLNAPANKYSTYRGIIFGNNIYVTNNSGTRLALVQLNKEPELIGDTFPAISSYEEMLVVSDGVYRFGGDVSKTTPVVEYEIK